MRIKITRQFFFFKFEIFRNENFIEETTMVTHNPQVNSRQRVATSMCQ